MVVMDPNRVFGRKERFEGNPGGDALFLMLCIPHVPPDGNIIRWKCEIILSSCEQCKRIDIPKVDEILSFDKMTDMKFDHAFFAYEGLSHESFNLAAEAAKVKEGERVLLIVGPEGGFDEKEVALATKKGLTPVSLGQRILRAETASIYMASVFSFLGESK